MSEMKSRPLRILLLGMIAGVALAGCASTGHDLADAPPITPTERFAIEVRPQPQELRLGTHAQGVSPNQAHALADFAQGWSSAQGGEVTLQTPSHGGDPAAAYRTAQGARDVLVASGVSAGAVKIVGYDAGGDHEAPIIIGYTRYVAQGPQCGQAWENLSNTTANREYNNFGCALTANVAAQIDNPADLLNPRDSTPADAGRRQQVLDHYRKGEVTSSAKDEQANGAVSRAVP